MIKMYDLTIALSTDGNQCLYEQIYEYIKQEIIQGKLSVGERLPSTRTLAEHLQVSRSTVELAFGQLVSEGYIEAKPCKGYFVCKVEELFRFTESGNSKVQPKEIVSGKKYFHVDLGKTDPDISDREEFRENKFSRAEFGGEEFRREKLRREEFRGEEFRREEFRREESRRQEPSKGAIMRIIAELRNSDSTFGSSNTY